MFFWQSSPHLVLVWHTNTNTPFIKKKEEKKILKLKKKKKELWKVELESGNTVGFIMPLILPLPIISFVLIFLFFFIFLYSYYYYYSFSLIHSRERYLFLFCYSMMIIRLFPLSQFSLPSLTFTYLSFVKKVKE